MARPLRITFPGAFYHVTARGNEQKAVFKSKRDRENFLAYLESATERYNAMIHAFCMMDNHYHLLLETPSGNLPQIMRHINGGYTMYFNTRRGRRGHLFQGRYKAILVEKDEYAKALSRYIHLNPVRANMVPTPRAHFWSSYNDYVGNRKAPEWLQQDFILGYFGKKISLARKGYRDFVMSLMDRESESPLKGVTGSVILGTDDFVKSIRERYLQGTPSSRDLPALRQIFPGVSIGAVIETVALSIGDQHAFSRHARIYLCRKHTGKKLRTIGNQFGISDSAVSQVCKRFKGQMEINRKLRERIEAIEKQINLSKVET
jgi:REP element-mobilizing transposase RayT